MPTIVVDANVMVGALMGRSFPLIASLAHRAVLVSPGEQLAETEAVVGRLGHPDLEGSMTQLLEVVSPLDHALYAPFEQRARERLHTRAQPDWPVLAAAMALDAAIWSRDPDLFGTGVPVWSTRNIRFVEAEAA